jgi:hypothetical protein
VGEPAYHAGEVHDWATNYMVAKIRLRRRTREKYESSLRIYLLPTFGDAYLNSITRDACSGGFSTCSSAASQQRPFGATTTPSLP